MHNKQGNGRCTPTTALLLFFCALFTSRFAVAGDWPTVFHFKNNDLEIIKNLPLVPLSLLDVQVPLQISKLPITMRQGTLVVGFAAVFYGYGSPHVSSSANSLSKSPVGFCSGRKKTDGLLSGGSLQKIMSVPSDECRGVIGNDFTVISYAVVKKENQCLPLGTGRKSSGDSGLDCSQRAGELPAEIFCNENSMLL